MMVRSKIPENPTFSNKLSKDYLERPDSMGDFIPNGFDSPRIRGFDVDRSWLRSVLEEYNEKIDAPAPVFRNIEKLSREDTYVVVTGQQPGIMTGPLYTIYKALTAISISEELSDENRFLIPLFWNASEDDDLSEIDHFFLLDENEPRRIHYDFGEERKVFSHLEIDISEIDKIINYIEELSPNSEFLDPLMNDLKEIANESATVSDFFSRLMSYLLGDYGLVLVEPEYLRNGMKPIFKELVRNPTKCTGLLKSKTSELESSGYSKMIHKPSGLCNFFLRDDSGRRRRVTFDGKNFDIGGEKLSKGDLITLIEEDPTCFCTNAVTRPVSQDFVLPTFGYVAGPGEISYLAQLRAVYDFFSVEMPVIYPRYGVTIVENKISKILDKYDIELMDLKEPERILKRIAGEDVDYVFRNLRGELMKNLNSANKELRDLDESLENYVSVARNDILKAVDKMEDGIRSELKRKDKIARRQILKGQNNIFPQEHLQERQLNVFEYLPKFGKKFLRIIHDDFSDAEIGEHRVIRCS